MNRAIRPEEAFELGLQDTTVDDRVVDNRVDDLRQTVFLLRATGYGLDAPASLRARRGALVAADHGRGASVPYSVRWRRLQAILLAAALTMLLAVGVGAATVGGGWLRRSEPLVEPRVHTLMPAREGVGDSDLDHPPSAAGPGTEATDDDTDTDDETADDDTDDDTDDDDTDATHATDTDTGDEVIDGDTDTDTDDTEGADAEQITDGGTAP